MMLAPVALWGLTIALYLEWLASSNILDRDTYLFPET